MLYLKYIFQNNEVSNVIIQSTSFTAFKAQKPVCHFYTLQFFLKKVFHREFLLSKNTLVLYNISSLNHQRHQITAYVKKADTI